jgi:YD repeat-containing protein
VLLLVAGPAGPAAGQDSTISYVYDELNRLVGVVDQQGRAAAYSYDPVGNLLAIERFDASGQPGPVRITLLSPRKGAVGTRVQIVGTGFSPTPSLNTVAFTGAAATVLEASATRLVTTVPTGATTGAITVTTPLGTAASPMPFQVLGEITVTPASTSVSISGVRQFQAFETGSPTTNVRWAVNGLPGGDATVGTITANGLYTAPASVPNPARVTITATRQDDPNVSASATVFIWPPLFFAAPPVSVRVAESLSVNNNLTAGVSVAVAPSAGPVPVVSAPVSVRVGSAAEATFTAAAPVSVSVAPVVTGVAPATGDRGAALPVTLTGVGLTDATSVEVLQNNAPDSAITVTNLSVSADGTQATVDLAIGAGATVGPRVVRITTPAGSSTAAGTGGNLFTVQ